MFNNRRGYDALSRMLARILRYHAQGPALQAASDGYVSLRQILLVEAQFKDYSEAEVVQVAKNSSSTKGNRFMIREARAGEEGPYIRAAYTHNRHSPQGKGCGKVGGKREQASGRRGQTESYGRGNTRVTARGNGRGNSDVILVWQPVNQTENNSLSSDSPRTSCPGSTLSFATESTSVWMQSPGDDQTGGRLEASIISSIDNYILSEGSEGEECYEIEQEFDRSWRNRDLAPKHPALCAGHSRGGEHATISWAEKLRDDRNFRTHGLAPKVPALSTSHSGGGKNAALTLAEKLGDGRNFRKRLPIGMSALKPPVPPHEEVDNACQFSQTLPWPSWHDASSNLHSQECFVSREWNTHLRNQESGTTTWSRDADTSSWHGWISNSGSRKDTRDTVPEERWWNSSRTWCDDTSNHYFSQTNGDKVEDDTEKNISNEDDEEGLIPESWTQYTDPRSKRCWLCNDRNPEEFFYLHEAAEAGWMRFQNPESDSMWWWNEDSRRFFYESTVPQI